MFPELRINERTGGTCCYPPDAPYACTQCKAHVASLRTAAASSDDLSAYAPPDPYALPMRIAEVQESVARLAALAEERKHFDALLAAQPAKPVLRLTAAELASYAPPDPYES